MRVSAPSPCSERLWFGIGFENGKLVRVVLRAVHSSLDTQVNTLHYDLIDSPLGVDNDPQTLADVFRDNVIVHFKALYDSGWTIQPVEVVMEKDPQNPNAARDAWQSGTPQTGTKVISVDQLPRAMCQVAQLRTDLVGRRHRGRMFIGGTYSEADQAGGNWQSLATGLANNLLNAIPREPDLATGTSDAVAHWVVYSRTQRAQNQDPYAARITSTPVLTICRWLRRRQQ